MHQAAIDLFQLLVQAGAVPGQDFSCDAEHQAYHLSDRCYDLLQTAYPEVDWLDILGSPYANVAAQIEALHEQLGYPFIETLITRMVDRAATLPDDHAAGYVQAILVGVESATGIALYPFLAEALDMAGQARLEWLLRQEVVAIPGEVCLLDLIMAAGGTEADCDCQNGEIWLTESGWRRLSQVWDGESTLVSAIAEPRSR